ncbi:MAG TPA: D-aminoacyl-tRNA deacylase [Candidatus Polarisedimenticolia bacterium]|jgi:D-tyrosyl-tRNA(Tyr) deacylase|nr:D-aminoacyl-tRNA deacylase [Candidatus Polarisedimenticolia bacterium]
MKGVIQRVSRAEVRVKGEVVGRIERGLLVLIGFERGDRASDLDWFSDKVIHMRIFEDSAGKMNRSALETSAGILVVSQFTLAGDLSRGRRPGFERAAPPEEAEPLYDAFVERLRRCPLTIATGRFREHMEVELVNDGPVTLILENRP